MTKKICTIIALYSIGGLSSCGQTGPLYLEDRYHLAMNKSPTITHTIKHHGSLLLQKPSATC